jgi:hypothetical protein
VEADGGEMLDAGAEIGASPRRWVRLVAVLVVLALVVASGAAIWARNQPAPERFCSVTGAADAPVGPSPDTAFAAWFARSGPADAVYMATQGGTTAQVAPTIDEFHRRSSTEWEWRYAKTGSVVVDVSRTHATGGPADGWTVTGVNQCILGHQDLQGPSTGG